MRVLVDTNIILDALLERQPFVTEAKALLQAIESGRIEGYVTATTLTDIFYIAKKPKGAAMAKQYVSQLLVILQVCAVDRSILEVAVSYSIADFEDSVQLACAIEENLDAIVTRDSQGFVSANLPILTAGEVIASLS